MTPEEREALERQAAEYALGTLPEDERAGFEARLAHDAEACKLVDAWDRRLAPLNEALAPIEPPLTLWPRIQRALAPEARQATSPRTLQAKRSFWSNLLVWRGLAGAGLAAAITLALVFTLGPREAPEAARYVAVLEDGRAAPIFVISIDQASGRLFARPVAAEAPSGRSLELWLIAGSAAPRSLGLLDATAPGTHTLPAELARAVAEPAVLAISLEPPGGSPTGQPTGPVIVKGALLRTGA